MRRAGPERAAGSQKFRVRYGQGPGTQRNFENPPLDRRAGCARVCIGEGCSPAHLKPRTRETPRTKMQTVDTTLHRLRHWRISPWASRPSPSYRCGRKRRRGSPNRKRGKPTILDAEGTIANVWTGRRGFGKRKPAFLAAPRVVPNTYPLRDCGRRGGGGSRFRNCFSAHSSRSGSGKRCSGTIPREAFASLSIARLALPIPKRPK